MIYMKDIKMLETRPYRFAELAEILGVSRSTAEKFPARYGLEEVEISYLGRPVGGVSLTSEQIEKIYKDYPKLLPNQKGIDTTNDSNDVLYDTHLNTVIGEYRDRIATLESTINTLQIDLSSAKEALSEQRITAARLEKDREKNEHIIKQMELRLLEKEETINTLKETIAAERARAESEKSRGDGFSNQISNLNSKLQLSKGSEDLETLMQNAWLKQKAELLAEISKSQSTDQKKILKFLGYTISR